MPQSHCQICGRPLPCLLGHPQQKSMMDDTWRKINQLRAEIGFIGAEITLLRRRQGDVANLLQATYEELADSITAKFTEEVTRGEESDRRQQPVAHSMARAADKRAIAGADPGAEA